MTTRFVTISQKALLDQALRLTNSHAFMADAVAIAAYQDGFDGQADYLKSIMVFEAFRPNRSAEFHFGMAFNAKVSLDVIRMGVTVAFHPKMFNLERIITKTPVENVNAICSLLKSGFEIQYRENNALANGGDVLVSALTRESVLKQITKTKSD